MSIWIIFIRIMDFRVIVRVIFRYGILDSLVWQSLIVILRVTVGLSGSISLDHSLHQVLGRIEHSRGLFAALEASL